MGRRKGIYCPTCERAYTTKIVFVLALLIGQSQQVPSQPSLVANILGPKSQPKKLAHPYVVSFSPPRSLLMIGPELHRLQIYRSEMTLPACSLHTWGRALPRRGCAPWPRGLAMCALRIASLAIIFSNVFILWALAVLCGM